MAARAFIRVAGCRRRFALRASNNDKVIAAHGNPIPFLRKDSREELRDATGSTKLPALRLPDGTVLTHSRSIMRWVDSRDEGPYSGMSQSGNQRAMSSSHGSSAPSWDLMRSSRSVSRACWPGAGTNG